MKSFKQMTDARLAALTWNPDEGMRALRAKAAPPPRRAMRQSAIAALALLMVLLTATALAVGLRMSRQVDAKRIAREAVMETYGLDAKSLGMLMEHASEENGVWIVTYGGEWKKDTVGQYTVVVQADGTAEASWSLEGSTDAWGQAEIAAYVEQKEAAFREMQQDEALAVRSTPEPIPEPTAVPGAQYTHAQAVDAAHQAMRTVFGFQEAGLSQFDYEVDYVGTTGPWQITYSAEIWHWPDGYLSDRTGTYAVEVEDGTGVIRSATWSLEGAEISPVTRETLGKAQIYDAQCMEWVAEIRSEYLKSYEQYGMLPGATPAEERARLDALMIAYGFDAKKYNHIVPGEDDIPLAQAKELAFQALQMQFGLSREVFDASIFAYEDFTQEETHKQWYFWIQDQNITQMGWTVLLDGQTGEILDLVEESFALGNG